MGPECAAGGSRRTHRCLPQVGPIRMADGAPKNSKNRWGACAAGNSPTDAVTTADISLTVRAYDHAGLGSPPPEHLGVRSGVGMPSPALLLLSLAAFTISKRGCGCWGDRVAAGPARKPAKSRPLQCCASTGERGGGSDHRLSRGLDRNGDPSFRSAPAASDPHRDGRATWPRGSARASARPLVSAARDGRRRCPRALRDRVSYCLSRSLQVCCSLARSDRASLSNSPYMASAKAAALLSAFRASVITF